MKRRIREAADRVTRLGEELEHRVVAAADHRVEGVEQVDEGRPPLPRFHFALRNLEWTQQLFRVDRARRL